MSWTYNNIRVTVTNMNDTAEQTIAELQPVNAGTAYQAFGWVNPKYTLGALVVGYTDRTSLLALMDDGVPYTLSGVNINWGSFYLKKITFDWLAVSRQTFRPDKSPTDPVFRCSMDLAKV
jgi:hypothetical protein